MFSQRFQAGRLLLSMLVATALLSPMPGRSTADDDTDSTSPESTSPDQETFDLSARPFDDTTTSVRVRLEVGGDLKVTALPNEETSVVKKLPMSVVADIAYEERVLDEHWPAPTAALGSTGTSDTASTDRSSTAIPTRRSVRYYQRAEAVIKVGEGGVEDSLADDRRLVVAETVDTKGQAGARIVLTSPDGLLTREQLDLIDIVGNSLVLPDLLPQQPIAIGQSWQHTEAAIAALVRLEAISHCDVQSTLVSVDGDQATLSMAGPVSGASEGVASEIVLKANYRVDLSAGRITQFNLAIEEKRPVGHSSPGVDVVANLEMRIEPLAEPNHLTAEVVDPLRRASRADVAKNGTQADAAPPAARLFHPLAGDQWQLAHDRRWYVTADTDQLTVLRMIDRGDLIAQCNIRPLVARSPERHLTLGQFQKDVRFALGDRFGELVSAVRWESKAGHRVLRVIVRGKVDDLPIEWRSYLVAHRDGPRLSVTFTVEGSLAERLGQSDRDLIASLDYVEPEPPVEATEPAAKTSDLVSEPTAAQADAASPSTEPSETKENKATSTKTEAAVDPLATDKKTVEKETDAQKPTAETGAPKKPVTTAGRPKRGRSIRLRR